MRQGERLRTLFLAGSILVIVASYMMVKAVRDAVFLAKFGSTELSLLYIGLAASAGVLSAIGTRLGHGAPAWKLVLGVNTVVAGSLVALWIGLHEHVPGLPWVLYVWSSFFGLFVLANFWLLANQVYDARSAKRIFPIVGAGAIAGGIVGGQLTGLATRIGALNLLPLIAAGFLLSAALAWLAWRTRDTSIREIRPPTVRPSAVEGFRVVRRSKYLMLIAGILVLGTIVTTLIDLQVKVVAKEHFGSSTDEMAAYFGRLTKYFSIVSLVVQLFITSRLIRRVGVGRTLLILPLAMALGAAAVGLHGAIGLSAVTAVALAKIGDGGLRFSLDKAATELLHVPVPATVRAKAKPLIDTVADRLGTALTGMLWLGLTLAVGTAASGLVVAGAVVTLVVICGWLLAVYRTRREYVEAFRVSLPGANGDRHRIKVDLRDHKQRLALRRALASSDERGVVLSLDVLLNALSPPEFPELPRLLDHPSPAVRARAFDLLSLVGNQRHVMRARKAAADGDPGVRAAAVRYLAHASDELVDELTTHPDVRVRLAALAYLAQQGRDEAARASGHIEEILAGPITDPRVKVELAAAVGALPPDEAERYLDRLLFDRDESVAHAAGVSAARLGVLRWVRPLLETLSDRARGPAARAALRGHGNEIVAELARALRDESLPRATRYQIPGLLAAAGSRQAADVLLSVLSSPDIPLRTRVVRALWRLRRHARVRLNNAAFERALADEARTYAAHLDALHEATQVEGLPGARLLARAIGEKLADDLERIFRLLGLRYPQRDVLAAYYGLRRDEASVRASALELLDNLLERPLERQLLALLENDGLPPSRGPRPSAAETLKALAADPDPWLRACAVYAIGEARLVDANVEPQLIAATRDEDPRVREAAHLVLESHAHHH